jgi:hypothetical protein
MIWFDIDKLERDLRNGNVSDRQVFYYLLATMVLFSITAYAPATDYKREWLLYVEMLAAVAITVIGILKTFEINSAGDKADYFRRFLALSFVNTIRLILFSAIPLIGVAFFLTETMESNHNLADAIDLSFVVVFGTLFYVLLANSFKRVSKVRVWPLEASA